jgi:hypothetical protein
MEKIFEEVWPWIKAGGIIYGVVCILALIAVAWFIVKIWKEIQ